MSKGAFEEWMKMLVQARRFAQLENYGDTVARLKEIKQQMEAEKSKRGSEFNDSNLPGLLHTVSDELQRVQTQYDAWNKGLEQKRKAARDNAEAEFEKPLPPTS